MKLRTFVSPMALAAGLAAIAPAAAQTANGANAPADQVGLRATPPAAPMVAGEGPIETTPAQDDTIVVTGTRIVRPNLKAASPITTVTEAEIKAQGAVNIEEVTNRLGQVTPDSQQVYASSNGKQKIKLRGLDFNRTLPLINGQRMGGAESIDTNIIPVSLVERVDVLTGGASSVYGSDAIAGVVNYIMKRDFTGLQISANYSVYNHTNRPNATTPVAAAFGIPSPTSGDVTDGGRSNIAITLGHNFLDDRLNISAFGEYRHADPILFRDRDLSGCQIGRDPTNVLAVNGLVCISSAPGGYGILTPQSGTNRGTNYSDSLDGSRSFALASTVPAYNNHKDRESARSFDRINAGGFLNFKVAPALEVSGSLLYLRDKSYNSFFGPFINSYGSYGNVAPYNGSTPYQVNCNNPLLSTAQASAICGTAAGTAAYAPLNIQYGFPGQTGDRSKDTFTNTQTRMTAGVRGDIAEGWKYDVGGVYEQNRDLWLTGGLPIFSKVLNALDVVNVNGVAACRSVVNGIDPACVPLDVFKANTTLTPALRSYLFSEELGRSDTQDHFYDATANITADLSRYGIRSPFAGQGLALAAGLEYRKQTRDIYRNARYTQVYGTSSISTQQDVKEANIEAQLPLVQDVKFLKLLQANGGYRLSKYSTNPDTFNTWKVEGVYSPTPDITFRVSKNRAQRAGGVNEIGQVVSYSEATGFQDPCSSVNGSNATASIEACRATGLPDNLYNTATIDCPSTGCRKRQNGNVITPEDARTLTYGLVLTPGFLPRFSFSVDRYKIVVNNIISFADPSFAINGCIANAQPYYCSLLVRNSDGTLFGSSPTSGFIQTGLVNQYRLYASGYDVDAHYSLPIAPIKGRLDFSFNGTVTTDSGGQSSVLTLRYNCSGYFGPICGPGTPSWVHTMRTTYLTDNGVFNASLAWRYIAGMTTSQNSGKDELGSKSTTTVTDEFAKIPAYNYFDLAIGINIAKRLSITASCNNIFDRMPPVLANTYAYTGLYRGNSFPARYDVLGRNMSIGVTTKF